MLLRIKGCTLDIRERFAARICEEAVEAANCMCHVPGDRGRAARPGRELLRIQRFDCSLDLFLRIEQRVSHRLKEGRDALNRPGQPRFRHAQSFRRGSGTFTPRFTSTL